MSANEWNITYANHSVCIVKSKLDGARLLVDDELLDTASCKSVVADIGSRERKWVTGQQTYALASV